MLPCTPSLLTKATIMATLGISTNTRLLGLAIIYRDNLIDYKIHLHKSSWSPSKANKIITSLEPCVRRYSIRNVILSIPYEHHTTKESKYLISLIQKYFEKQNIPVKAVSPEAFYPLYPEGQKKTKKVLMKSLTEKFPELRYCYNKELRNKKRYYVKLFEAVAVASLKEESS